MVDVWWSHFPQFNSRRFFQSFEQSLLNMNQAKRKIRLRTPEFFNDTKLKFNSRMHSPYYNFYLWSRLSCPKDSSFLIFWTWTFSTLRSIVISILNNFTFTLHYWYTNFYDAWKIYKKKWRFINLQSAEQDYNEHNNRHRFCCSVHQSKIDAKIDVIERWSSLHAGK